MLAHCFARFDSMAADLSSRRSLFLLVWLLTACGPKQPTSCSSLPCIADLPDAGCVWTVPACCGGNAAVCGYYVDLASGTQAELALDSRDAGRCVFTMFSGCR